MRLDDGARMSIIHRDDAPSQAGGRPRHSGEDVRADRTVGIEDRDGTLEMGSKTRRT
jgi:hypothetical protein